MNPIKRVLTAFIFYPLLVLWFIPKEAYRAFRKARRMNIQTPLSFQETTRIAKGLFRHELQVAMSARTRKPIDYSYLDEALRDVKKIANEKEKAELIIENEIKVTKDGQTTGGSGN
jgi:hypothetical protein